MQHAGSLPQQPHAARQVKEYMCPLLIYQAARRNSDTQCHTPRCHCINSLLIGRAKTVALTPPPD